MSKILKDKKVYELIIDEIENDKLPSVEKLSEKMNISKEKIKDGLKVLESMDIIECVSEKDNFICSCPEKILLKPLSIMFEINNSKDIDILKLRKIIEIESVRLASIRANSEECMKLNNIITDMEKAIGEKKYFIFMELNKSFHQKIVSMSENRLIEYVYKVLYILFQQYKKELNLKIDLQKFANLERINQYRKIYESIKNRDENLAVKKMNEHIDYLERNFSIENKLG